MVPFHIIVLRFARTNVKLISTKLTLYSNNLNLRRFWHQEAEFSRMPRTPPPVEGRMHMDAQTEEFLEELMDRPAEVKCSTAEACSVMEQSRQALANTKPRGLEP